VVKQEKAGIDKQNGDGKAKGSEKGVLEKQVYFYHPDHLGSTSYVTDTKGEVYQHVEYFPFGESWVEQVRNAQQVAFGFTGKELDAETGLYYFGARYYDARTSVWVSPDPILGAYLPTGKKDEQLPGMGGVFNSFNLGLYSYGHLNPVKFVDPDGNQTDNDDPPQQKTLNQRIYEATMALKGTSSEESRLGRPACAWSVNQILKKAGIKPLGKNPNLVNDVEKDILGGRGIEIKDQKDAIQGDIVIIHKKKINRTDNHTGIVIKDGADGKNAVLSHSSTPRTISLVTDVNFQYKGSPYSGAKSKIYRLISSTVEKQLSEVVVIGISRKPKPAYLSTAPIKIPDFPASLAE